MTQFWRKPDLLVLHGSHLFGCATPESDVDHRGFVVEPGEFLVGRKAFEQHEDRENDVVIYGAPKFFKLLEKGAPNCIEILFAPQENILECSELGQMVLDNRDLFVTKKLTQAIRGFASSEWRAAQLLHKDKETGEVRHSTRVVGARRKESYAKHGYSTKNAYHAIRLLDEGVELLRSGTVTFPRPNVEELHGIRNGEIPFEELAERREQLAQDFMEAEEGTSLPEATDRQAVSDLYSKVVSRSVRAHLEAVERKK